jgi:putative heme iron utilization protein
MRDENKAARRLIRGVRTAALATVLPDGGIPYASLVEIATDQSGAPVLLISRLAEHTRAILADPRVALLVDAASGQPEPLTRPRLSLVGRLEPLSDETAKARYLARLPSAALYAGFADFSFWRMAVDRGHLVAGFGKIRWIAGTDLALPPAPALAEAEAGILEHMNADHADAVQLYATRLLGQLEAAGWRLCGIDPEGCDILGHDRHLRLDFDVAVSDAETARRELVRLVRAARGAG